ncbi:LOW QUALITY PROTEIN: hypothetical protein PHMEG_0001222 [Phytophthora megakarya]|uniref:Tf2-1-like SH3-like domain-containing protein n=1 Tax=Phytophthora megakarya TaxID=4795 RepID=A0A225X2B6_9STRA|nr:LOW QUALITY PROTEIN: hypothetical protein PHMEG_0001222 [Phytophthora megakarya]
MLILLSSPLQPACHRLKLTQGTESTGSVEQSQHQDTKYAKQFQDRRQEVIDGAKSIFFKPKAKKYYDKKRSSITFKEGEMVMLDTRRIPAAHVTKAIDGKRAKLATRKVEPFQILKMVNPNVAKLKLP